MNTHKSNLTKLIKQNSYRHSARKVFADFIALSSISISNAVDLRHWDEREKRYMDIISGYDRDEIDRFPKMLAELVAALETEMTDVLGQVYMELELGSKQTGQFFTPWSVCQMMAEIAVTDAGEKIENNGFITVNEPAVGGGAMIIALAEALKKAGYNYQKQMVVIATDIDIRSVYMCYLQLSLLGIPAVVYHGDTLSLKMYSEWFTPAYILGGWSLRKWREEKKEPDIKNITGEAEQLKLELVV